MNIQQFRYSSDNLGYVLYGRRTALAIDGGAVDDIASFLDEKGLDLKFAANTHGHPDHTSGTRRLIGRTGARYLDHETLMKKKAVEIEGETAQVLHTPGHTPDSMTFFADGFLVAGDTLFNGTIGNCFSGDLRGFYESIKTLMAFPPDTVIYAGHDYVEYAMAFARVIEPDHPHIDAYLKKYDPRLVRSTMGDEMKVNPYLRFNDPGMIDVLKKRGLAHSNEYERWESIMTLS
ncbi:conserved hypothetical protein [Candidatus Desulfarcum epimagneticum]|uniref:hydroxyacylglutathione hydrolase n=1 Tax=uncultured Desulfobacteraceae bacterium TaxID=218296 RepID=A0A484HLS6_9BACT|nr:conserved hypothetical protein [uncultured Desulfobacteraceae bacterium]